MNSFAQAQTGYAQINAIAPTDRDTEYRVFADVTRRISELSPENPQDFPALAEAMHKNLRLWSFLAVDVADPGNALPSGLRAQIFYLAEFTQQHTSKVLNERASPDVLVEINTAIMRGLRAAKADVAAV